jgi:hypothetical protein
MHEGLQGAWVVAEDYRGLWEAVGCRGGTPMISITPLKVDGCGEQDRNHDDQTCIKN